MVNVFFLESVKSSSGQLTSTTMARHSQMLEIGEKMDELLSVMLGGIENPHTRAHGGRLQQEKEVRALAEELIPDDLFCLTERRSHKFFSDFIHDVFVEDAEKLKQRILYHRDNIVDMKKLAINAQVV